MKRTPVFDTPDPKFAQCVAERRREVGMVQWQVAHAMVVAGFPQWRQSTVTDVERAKRRVSLKEAEALANVLGVHVTDLMADHQRSVSRPPRDVLDAMVRAISAEAVQALTNAWTAGRDTGATEMMRVCVENAKAHEHRLRDAALTVLGAYQQFLDTDDLDQLRDALTELQEAVE